MLTALFTYRRRVVLQDNTEVFNDNFINPLTVTSFYWQLNVEGNKILSVYLTNQYVITFGESVGKRFVDHMEDFLRYFIGAGVAKATQQRQERHTRKPISAEVIDEEPSATAVEWQTQA